MTASMIVDYKNIYPQVPNFTIIHGDTTYPQLQLLINQIKSNASSLQNDLVRGIHGHIGLILIPENYDNV